MESTLIELGLGQDSCQVSAKVVDVMQMDRYLLLLLEDQTGRKVVSYNENLVKFQKDKVYNFKSLTRSVRSPNGYVKVYTSVSEAKPLKLDPQIYTFKNNLESKTVRRNLVYPELVLKIVKTQIKVNRDGSNRAELVLKDENNHSYYLSIFESLKSYESVVEAGTERTVLLQNYSCTTEDGKNYTKLQSTPFSNVSL